MTAYGTSSIYNKASNPSEVDIHHNVLQYLEEGVIDLVCIATDLDMDRCKTMRAKFTNAGRCDCWFAAYKAMYGAQPTVDSSRFTTCTPRATDSLPESSSATGLQFRLLNLFGTWFALTFFVAVY